VALKGTQIMKGKRHTTEQKIRILREADGGKSIVEVSKEHNISEVTFHRWKRQFGQLDVNEARRMKELERENAELKKMLADSLLKNRVLEAVNAKNGKPGTQASDGRLRGGRRAVLRADGVPVPATGTLEFPLSNATADERAHAVGHTAARTLAQVSALRLSPDRGEAAW
jgi:putative transposase